VIRSGARGRATASGTAASIAFLALAALSARSEDEYEDLMGGFEDEFGDADIDAFEDDEGLHPWLAALPYGEQIAERVDLSGSIASGASYNYLDHKVSNPDRPGESTSWGNLSRLDLDGFLQLDVQLPHKWLLRAEATGFYDFVYRIKGRSNYGDDVIDVYEWEVDTGELYLAGPLHADVDLTLGRKIVNWGRSDTFRIVDVVNALDNREPGLVDIEDIRRPVGMAKIDYSSGPWSASFLVIPESRYDREPPPGSDFFPDVRRVPRTQISGRRNFDGMPGMAGRFNGNFSGWDFSLYGARVDETRRVLDPKTLTREANRYGLFGFGGNYTVGAWLLKLESAWLHDVHVLRATQQGTRFQAVDKHRIDTMVGVEYYGRDSLVIALEIVNRHLLDYGRGDSGPVQTVEQSIFETGLRITRPFFNERLDVTALGVAFGEALQDGGLFRFSADYELADAWSVGGGILMYFEGTNNENNGIGLFDSNDRLFAELKYSF